MNNFERLKSMSVDELVEWLDKHGQFDNSPWMLWWDRNYCQKCEDIVCKSPDDSRQFPCAYCEIYDKCRYFQDQEDVPDNKEIIKMWLESEVETSNKTVDDELDELFTLNDARVAEMIEFEEKTKDG